MINGFGIRVEGLGIGMQRLWIRV